MRRVGYPAGLLPFQAVNLQPSARATLLSPCGNGAEEGDEDRRRNSTENRQPLIGGSALRRLAGPQATSRVGRSCTRQGALRVRKASDRNAFSFDRHFAVGIGDS